MSYIGMVEPYGDGSGQYMIGSTMTFRCESNAYDDKQAYSDLVGDELASEAIESIISGLVIRVWFQNTNTTEHPSLSLNNGSFYPIYLDWSLNEYAGTTESTSWAADEVVTLIFHDDAWVIVRSSSQDSQEIDTSNFITGSGTSGYLAKFNGSKSLTTGVALGSTTTTFLSNAGTWLKPTSSWFGTCSTAGSTAAKVVSCSSYTLTTHFIISVKMTYANTYKSGALTLNVNSTGAKTIYKGSSATSSSNTLTWAAGDILTFIYSGSYYYFVSSSSPSASVTSITTTSIDSICS